MSPHRADNAALGSAEAPELPREAEVNDLDVEVGAAAVAEHDVVGFDVHVDNPPLVHKTQGL